MSQACPSCGEPLKNPDVLFCPNCGEPLKEVPISDYPFVFIRVPFQSPRQLPLDRDTFTIGRRSDNDIVLPAGYVSGHHARLDKEETGWQYTDLDSTNGTYVNGERVTSVTLKDGDIIRIGDLHGNSVSLTFRVSGSGDVTMPTPSAIRMGSTALGMRGTLLVGRDPKSDVHIDAPTVSWHHARLEQTASGHVLVDLNSTNGTFVNGERLDKPYVLKEGDVVQVGPHRLIYSDAGLQQYAATGGMRLDGVSVVWEVGRGERKRTILKGIDISVYPREFVALVGASGAGKSTLLKALNGFTHAQGQVLVNGDDLYKQFDLYRTMLGYVPQQDSIHKGLTVDSTLHYAARLRLPSDMSDAEIEQRIEQVLHQVGMLEQRYNPITRLSGGQQKRVNIAVELLAEPRLFFLDEPTSGLDPGLEKKMMHTLRRLADGGRTVVLVTHATANITQCDHVCFLAKGRLVYYGPPAEALEYFGVESGDFADIYDRLDDSDPAQARAKAEEWEQRFKASEQYQKYVAKRLETLPQATAEAAAKAASRSRPKVNQVRQFFVLTRRYMDLVVRDRLLLTILLAVMPVIALLLAIIAEPNWLVGNSLADIERQLAGALAAGESSATYAVVGASQTLLFMLALAAVLLGLFASAYEVVKERPVFMRERMINVRLFPYLGSKVTVLGGFALLQCLLLLFVLSWKVDLPRAGVLVAAPVEMYVSLVLGALAATMLGLFVSALVPNTNSVIYIVLLLLFFQIIFAGVFFELPGVTSNLSNFTFSRWVMEALGTSANLEGLNALTRTRYQPEPVEEQIRIPVQGPPADFEPMTVVTETRYVEVTIEPDIVRTVPISAPRLIRNDPVTVTRILAEEITFEPDAVDIYGRHAFQVDYARSQAHLWWVWGVLAALVVGFGLGTIVVLELKDVW
ncbi:MAG: FHA domain-containing protein [Anaerolineae bacterium]|nr:FHA domain-containing protein [Anaerolineae bacterium]